MNKKTIAFVALMVVMFLFVLIVYPLFDRMADEYGFLPAAAILAVCLFSPDIVGYVSRSFNLKKFKGL